MILILTVMFAGLTPPVALYGQRVYKENDRVFLDLADGGMPADAITSISKIKPDVVASDTGGPMADNKVSESINATLYRQLEIAQYDINDAGEIGGSGTMVMSWATAFNNCRNLGEGWRLPTQRELILMNVFKDALEEAGAEITNAHWSATEVDGQNSWGVFFQTVASTVAVYAKTVPSVRARCVREVVSP